MGTPAVGGSQPSPYASLLGRAAEARVEEPQMPQATFRPNPVFLGIRSWVRLAFVTSATYTPPFAPLVRFERGKVSTFPKSKSPEAAFSRAPGMFYNSRRSFRPVI